MMKNRFGNLQSIKIQTKVSMKIDKPNGATKKKYAQMNSTMMQSTSKKTKRRELGSNAYHYGAQ